MSGQGPQAAHKVRRNVSPSQTQRQGPMKAVMPFILKHSPSRSPSSPVLSWVQRRSPVSDRLSPDSRRSPSSPGSFKVERPKPVRVSPASSSLRRTSSLDTLGNTLGTYLKGQWPADIGGCHHNQQSGGTFMVDKTTQTSDDWREANTSKAEKKKRKHRRSASFGHADKKLGPKYIREKLQKTTKDQGNKQRSSPVPGNHNALLQTAPAVLMRSVNIPIAATLVPKTSMSRFQRNSVEGLNPEIDKLLALNLSGNEDDAERAINIPDGHRAPVPDKLRTSSGTRSVDTQTPSGTIEAGGRSSQESLASPASRPHSISPAIPIIPGNMENSPRPSSCYDSLGSTPRSRSDKDAGDSDSISPEVYNKKSSSPQPNTWVRSPPDGCEKVMVYDEDSTGKAPSIKEPLLFSPTPGQYVFKQSDSSAFCSLKKIYQPQGNCSYSQTSPINKSILENQ